MQNDILAANVFRGFVFQNEFDRGGDFEPAHIAHHARRHIGGAHARGECADRAVRAGVAVRADDEIARTHQSFFGEKRVLDAHFAHVKKVFYAVLVGEIAHGLDLFRRLDVFIGGKVVHYHAHAVAAFHAGKARLAEFFYRNGRGDVVAENHVQFRIDQLSRLHAVKPCVIGENFL